MLKLTLLALVALTSAAPTNQRELGKQKKDQCESLSLQDFEVDVEWEIGSKNAAAYPCSNGYAANFAANKDLLKQVRKKLDNMGLGKCSRYCDINNAVNKAAPAPCSGEGEDRTCSGYELMGAAWGEDDLKHELSSSFCGAADGSDGKIGFLNGASGYRDVDACQCAPDFDSAEEAAAAPFGTSAGYIAGCSTCHAKVKFSTGKCNNKP